MNQRALLGYFAASLLLACTGAVPGSEPGSTQSVPAPAPPRSDLAVEARAQATWQWNAGPDLYPFVPLELAAGKDRYVLWSEVSAKEESSPGRLRRERSDGTVMWSVVAPPAVPVAGGRHAYTVGAALAADADRVYVAQYDRIATGCTLSALAPADGHTLWTVPLAAAGPVHHSKYLNRVQLLTLQGDPVVLGWESAARYIEHRDGASGRLLSNQKLPGERFRPDINEAVYSEVAKQLRRSPTYTVSLADFLTRHVLTDQFPDQAARLLLARNAAARLSGLPVWGTGWHINLHVADRAGGRDVILQAQR